MNQASGSYLRVGDDLRSCTSEIQESEEFILDGRRVVLIDTPGFDDTHKSDADALKYIAAYLGESYVRICVSPFFGTTEREIFRYSTGAKLAGVVYVHKISDTRFGGLAAKNFRMFRELCGEKTLKNVVLMTTMWGEVTPSIGANRERQLHGTYFKAAIEKGAQLRRHDNTAESAREILRTILKNQPVVLKIQHELIDEHKDIGQTGAGAELNREMREVVEKCQNEIRELEESMRKAMEEKDEQAREELEEERRRLQGEMEELRKDSDEIRSKFEAAQREMEERITAKFADLMRRQEAEHEGEIQQYEGRLKDLERGGRENASHIASLEEKVAELDKASWKWPSKCVMM